MKAPWFHCKARHRITLVDNMIPLRKYEARTELYLNVKQRDKLRMGGKLSLTKER